MRSPFDAELIDRFAEVLDGLFQEPLSKKLLRISQTCSIRSSAKRMRIIWDKTLRNKRRLLALL